MTKTSPAQIKSVNKYSKANTKLLTVRLNKKTDADVLDHLETVGSKSGYIKRLIREDMRKEI